jgi:transketolase
MVWEAIYAHEQLSKLGTSARVINMHTIKPLDEAMVIKAARETGRIICAEEHQVTGGLGSAVAECLARNYPVPIGFVGMPDSFGESGKPRELMDKYGMSGNQIIKSAENLLKK